MISSPEQDLKELRAGAVPGCGRAGAEDTAGGSRALGRHVNVSHFARLISHSPQWGFDYVSVSYFSLSHSNKSSI